MKRLSRLRRHRAAGPILLIFALFTIGTTFQVASAVNNDATSVADRSVTIEEGKQIFLSKIVSTLKSFSSKSVNTRIPSVMFRA